MATTGYILNLGEIRSHSKHVIHSEQSPPPISARGLRKNSSSATNNQNPKIGWKNSNDGALSARDHATYKIANHIEGSETHAAFPKTIPTSSSVSKIV